MTQWTLTYGCALFKLPIAVLSEPIKTAIKSAESVIRPFGFSGQVPTWCASTCAAPHRSASRGWVGGPRLWMVLLGVAWREWEALFGLCSIDCIQRRERKGKGELIKRLIWVLINTDEF